MFANDEIDAVLRAIVRENSSAEVCAVLKAASCVEERLLY